MSKHIFIALFASLPTFLLGQNNATDTLPKSLETVEISATRMTLTDIKAPLAVTVLNKNLIPAALHVC